MCLLSSGAKRAAATGVVRADEAGLGGGMVRGAAGIGRRERSGAAGLSCRLWGCTVARWVLGVAAGVHVLLIAVATLALSATGSLASCKER